MIAVVQRVKSAKVGLNDHPDQSSSIGPGLIVLLGVGSDDTETDVSKLTSKLLKLRILSDKADKMNLSILEKRQEVMVISQFTLIADLKGGNRPSFIKAAPPEVAKKYYEKFISDLVAAGIPTKQGFFGGYMIIDLVLDGPVTIVLDSKKL